MNNSGHVYLQGQGKVKGVRAEVCGYQLNLELGRNRGTGMTCQTTVAWGWV